jgi:transcriptional regulator with XRE-family HTH domain
MSKNFLKQIREAKGLSQIDLAVRAGVSKQLLSGFENGRSGISNEVLQRIAEILEVSTDAIFSGKSQNPFDEKGRKILLQAMQNTFEFYGDKFDKETIIKIATELYGIMIDFESVDNKSMQKEFCRELEDKITLGFASQCFLNFHKNESDK